MSGEGIAVESGGVWIRKGEQNTMPFVVPNKSAICVWQHEEVMMVGLYPICSPRPLGFLPLLSYMVY